MTKRSYGTGTITSEGDNHRLRYRVGGRRFSKTVQGTRKEAERELRTLLKAGDDGRHIAPSKITFGQWAAEWLELKRPKLAGQTLERYEVLLRVHVLPVLGERRLQAIGARDIDQLYGGLSLAPRSKGFLHVVVKQCFKSAVRKKLIPANPVDDAERPNDEDADAGTVLEEAEMAALVQGFAGHDLHGIVMVAAMTGARRSEILALRREDLVGNKLTINKSVEKTKAGGLRVKGTKSAKHARTIEIDAGLVAMLAAKGPGLLFPAADGGLRSPTAVSQAFGVRARALGFAIRLHDLRGSHETWLLDKGRGVHVVAARCGHDPAMLMRVYAKRTKQADAVAASDLQSLGTALGLTGLRLVAKG